MNEIFNRLNDTTLERKTAIMEGLESVVREFTDRLRRIRKSVIFEEYESLCSEIYEAPWYPDAFAKQTDVTKKKNRYTDVLPYEQTRVRLESDTGDYINANFAGGENSEREYIVCSSPPPAAMADFWNMIWQYQVPVVLMLTNFVENERLKADMYWNEKKDCPVHIGNIVVCLVRYEEVPVGYIVRTFEITNLEHENNEPRLLQHIQLTSWPDHGVLTDFSVIGPMLRIVHEIRGEKMSNSPAIVHCSAGIGRSGTFLAIDIILNSLKSQFDLLCNSESIPTMVEICDRLKACLDIRSVVLRLRHQRDGSVQTKYQYRMIYDYIEEVLRKTQE